MSQVSPSAIPNFGQINKEKTQLLQEESQEELSLYGDHVKKVETMTWIRENVILLCITYNFFTCCYFLGIPGFPMGIWTYIEFIVEVMMIVDILIRLVQKYISRRSLNKVTMFVDINDELKATQLIVYFISSVPTSIIIYSSIPSQNQANLGIAFIRCLKLFRLRQLGIQFDVLDIRSNKGSFVRTLQATIYILMVTHFLACFWLFMPRVDPQEDLTWIRLVKYNQYDVPNIQKYIDSVFFIISTMTGLGFAFIYPRTDFEYAMESVIMLIGVSVYANFFAFFIVSIYNRNRKQIENMMRFEEFKQLAVLRHFPKSIRIQTREYYNSLRLKYDALSSKFDIVNEMPNSLRSEMSLYINSEMIQKINFFQFADPNFILRISTCFKPQLCLQDSYVVRLGEVANKMFFIKTGIVQVLATDNKTTIAYMSEGAYFGEIGVLLTQKRTCSILSNTISIFYTISKEQLTEVLQEFPLQLIYLRAVARQRLKTTNPEDINDQDKNFQSSALMKLQRICFGQSQTSQDNEVLPLQEPQEVPLRYHLTEEYKYLSYFIIIPMSRFFNVWSLVYCTTITYNLLYVPFAISLDNQFTGLYLIFDITAIILTLVDSLLRPFLAINKQHLILIQPFTSRVDEIEIDRDKLLDNYIKKQILFDIFGTIPFDYVMMIIDDSVYVRYFRLLRILKVYRVFEMISIIKKHAIINIPIFNIIVVFLAYIITSHWFTCLLLLFCRWELNMNRRYDGKTLLGLIPTTSYLPVDQMSNIELYFNLLIIGTCYMGSIMYGDITPFTISEETVSIFEMLIGRVFIAFMFAEISSYIGQKYQSYNEHMQKLKLVMKWVKINELQSDINARIQRYFQMTWINQKGIQENKLINDVPSALKKNINNFIFDELIQNCALFPKDNYGEITTITSHLQRKVFPKDEFIIKQGELANEMYFIMKGEVNVITQAGIKLASLKKNQYFGEMALINGISSVRSTSIIAETNVTVAVLTINNFRMICKHYPEFRTRIKEIVDQRTKDSKNKGVSITNISPNIQNTGFKNQLTIRSQKQGNQLSMIQEESKRESFTDQQNKQGNLSFQHQLDAASISSFQKPRLQMNSAIIEELANFVSPRYETKIQPRISSTLATLNQMKLLDVIEDNESNKDQSNSSSKDSDESIPHSRIQEDQNNIQIDRGTLNTASDLVAVVTIQDEDVIQTIEESDIETKNVFQLSSQRNLVQRNNKLPQNTNNIKNALIMSSSTSNFEEYLYQFKSQQEQKEGTFTSMFVFYAFKYLLLFPLTLYNIVFIPLQMGFSIQFTNWYLFAEIITLLCYSVDIFFAARHYQQLRNNILNINNQTDVDLDDIENKIRVSKIELFTSILATIPFSLIFQRTQNVLAIVNFLRILRMMKLLPLYKVLQHLKKFNVKAVRYLEIILAYYVIAHIVACVMLSVGLASKSDISNTWMNKIPIPLPSGTLQTDIDQISWSTLYIHAIYFAANTISHVAIGDLTSVSTDERTLNAFMIWILTFFYAFLFANIASIFIEGNNFLFFNEKYQHIMSIIPKDRLSSSLLTKISTYYEYLWVTSQGYDEQRDIFRVLPSQLMYDVIRERFSEGFENSLIFKNAFNESDEAIMNSFVQLMHIRVFMPKDFIVKVGSTSQQLYIVLDGQAAIVGINNNLLGVMKSGSHFNQDIGKGSDTVYHGKRIVHIVSQTVCTVGIIEEKDLLILYEAFPQWKTLIRKLNSYTHEKAMTSLNQYVQDQKTEEMKSIEDHFAYSDEMIYNNILKFLDSDKNEFLHDPNSNQFKDYDLMLQQATMLENGNGLRNDQKLSFEAGNKLKQKRNSPSFQFSQLLKKKQKTNKCRLCKVSFTRNSKVRTTIDFLHMLNLIYIAIAVPFHIAFLPKLDNISGLFFESLSIFLQLLVIFMNLRTPILQDGEYTLKMIPVLMNYLKNGMIIDIMGVLPINLIVGFIQPRSIHIVILALLRITRILSVVRLINLLEKFQIYLKNMTIIMVLFKAILLLVFILHWASCTWFFINTAEQGSYEHTWLEWFQIEQKLLSEQYMLSCYYVIKIVTGVGQGDMIAYNNLERIVFIIIINIGDALFAISLGLIAQVQMHIYDNNEFQQFLHKMKEIEEFLESISSEDPQRKKVQQYFSYNYFSKNKKHMVEAHELQDYLPETLVREVLYETSKDVLTPMFKDFNSENLVKELTFVLKNVIFTPGDYIIQKDQMGEEMYFIQEGTVHVIGGDKSTVLKTLTKGSYFGEIAIFMKTRRMAYVQAKTFCIISILKKPDIDNIILQFPSLGNLFSQVAQKRIDEIKLIEQAKLQRKQNNSSWNQSDEDSVDESFLVALQNKIESNHESQSIFSDRTHQSLIKNIKESSSNVLQLSEQFKPLNRLKTNDMLQGKDKFLTQGVTNLGQNRPSAAEKFKKQRKSIKRHNESLNKFKSSEHLNSNIFMNEFEGYQASDHDSPRFEKPLPKEFFELGTNQNNNLKYETQIMTPRIVSSEDEQNTAVKVDLFKGVSTSFKNQKFTHSPLSNIEKQSSEAFPLSLSPDSLKIKNKIFNRSLTFSMPAQKLSFDQHGVNNLASVTQSFSPVIPDINHEQLKQQRRANRKYSHLLFKNAIDANEEDEAKGEDVSKTIRCKGTKKNKRRLSQIQIGHHLMLSRTTGLKLQWQVGQ